MHQTQRQITATHVVAERAKWRDKIRSMMSSAISTRRLVERKELWITLKLNTNPKESDDKEIVAKSKKMITPVLSQQDWEALADRIALLLKHDWERAKFETYWYRTFWFPRELSPCVI